MKVTAIIENTSENKALAAEWGLSLYIEYRGNKYLLDTGCSGKFVKNAQALGIALSDIDYAVLSHAHYDHSGGMKAFFETNQKASFYLREGALPNCYGKRLFLRVYIGIAPKMLRQNENRIVYVGGNYRLQEGVSLIPHSTPGLEALGRKSYLYIKREGRYVPDDFAHEQSLVFETEKGLVIFNSCSHGRVDNIVREVQSAFPDQSIYAYVGGLHLAHASEDSVREYAAQMKRLGIARIYTGHCTGAKAYGILKEVLGDTIHPLYTGVQFTL